MLANDVKKGTPLVHVNGTHGIMDDNRKGIIRNFKPTEGLDAGWSRGCYIWELRLVNADGTSEPLELTAVQQRQAKNVEGHG